MGLRIIRTNSALELVDDQGKVLAREPFGVALSTDSSGHEHDAAGQFAKSAHEASKKTTIQKSLEHEASTEALKSTKRALKSGYSHDHAAAADLHTRAADLHAKRGDRWNYSNADAAGKLVKLHSETEKLHRKAAESHRAAVRPFVGPLQEPK